jgi:hypothetical protein
LSLACNPCAAQHAKSVTALATGTERERLRFAPNMDAAAAASPDSGHHELDDMADKKPSLAVEDDVMQLARLGEIGAIKKLFDSGACDATYTDEQGITPLHVRTRST